MRLLLAEDEAHAGEYLVKGLGENGFIADWVRTGPEAVSHAAAAEYDLIILDVGLPGMDGWSVLEEIRRHHQTPVLFLTARDRVEDRVRGLELGADDYLVKPYAFSELLARVRALLRRGKEREGDVLRIGDLEVHLLRRRVERAGQRIDLTAKEYALLLLFLRRRGEVLSRTLIAEQVWDMNFDSDTNVVEVAVRRLRAKIDDPFPKRLLHTVRGFGYVMEERSP
jgi:two-component system, OmpR family, copper resistance phosphate regulon response regulator CusR